MGKRKYENITEKSADVHVTEENEAKSKKVEKTENEEGTRNSFDIKHFRKELALKQGQTIALNQFVQVCTNPDAQVDYLEVYLKSGGNSHEILHQLSTDNKKNVTLASPTFQIFQMIVMKVQTSMPQMITITEEACRYFLNTFSPTVEIMISENAGPKHKKIILKLLTSMVTLNADLGVEILNQPGMSVKNLQHLVEKPNYKDKENIRTLFVHFVTSLLIDGHLPLIKALLEKQGLMSLVIPGLIQDEGEAVLMFLNILKRNVLQNANISKTLKLKTFTQQILQNMFKLYFWKGPPDLQLEDRNEFKSAIISLADQILTIIFTSNKLGLYFIDKTLGTSDAQKNQILYKALLLLKRPWENVDQSKIILKIVQTCPDLHRAIVTILDHSFEPDHSPQWEKTIGFFSKLLEELAPHTMTEKMTEMSSFQIANFIRFTSLPVPLLKHLTSGFKVNDVPISSACSKTLIQMLTYLKKYIAIFKTYNPHVVDILFNRFEMFIPKHLPSPDIILAIINEVVHNGVTLNKKVDYTLPNTDAVSVLINFIDLLLLYNGFYPAALEYIESNFDIDKILKFANSIDSERKYILKFKILSLWLTIDPMALSSNKPLYKDFLSIMLDIYLSNNNEYAAEANAMITKLMKSMDLFQMKHKEVDLILYTFKTVNFKEIDIIISLFDFIVENQNELVAITMKANSTMGPDIDNNITDIDILFDLLANDQPVVMNKTTTKTLSPFLIGTLKFMASDKIIKKKLKGFFTNLSVNLLHYLNNPLYLSSLTNECKYGSQSYINEWCNDISYLPSEFTECNEIIKQIENVILKRDDVMFDNIFDFIINIRENVEESDFTVYNKHYSVKSNTKPNTQELINISYILSFYIYQLAVKDLLDDEKENRIAELIEKVINIGKFCNDFTVINEVIENVLTDDMLRIFSPLKNRKHESSNILTRFLIKFHTSIKSISRHVVNVDGIVPFRKKVFDVVKKYLDKMNKKQCGLNCEQLVDVITNIGFNTDDVIEILNICFNLDAKCFVIDNNLPSTATIILENSLKNQSNVINIETFNNIFKMYCKIIGYTENKLNLSQLEHALVEFLRRNPHSLCKIDSNDFRIALKSSGARITTSKLVVHLLKYNEKFIEVFKEEISNSDVLKQREITIPLSSAVVQHDKFVKNNSELLMTIFNEYKQSILKGLEKPHKTGQLIVANVDLMVVLIRECFDLNDCKSFLSKIQKFESTNYFHIKLINALLLKYIPLEQNPDKADKISNYMLTTMNLINNLIKSDEIADVTTQVIKEFNSILDVIAYEQIDLKSSNKIAESNIWQNFSKYVIKNALKMTNKADDNDIGAKLLQLMTRVVSVVYSENHQDIPNLFDMVTSHSEFLNVMLSYHSKDIKESLVYIIFTLVKLNESVMKIQQVPLYLSAYHATQSKCDKLLLSILYHYERHGLPVNDYKPYLWGDSAANFYAVRKNKKTLWSQPTANQIINLFDKDFIAKTVRYFSVHEYLTYEEAENINVKKLLDELSNDKVSLKNVNDNCSQIESKINWLLLKAKYEKSIEVIKHIDFGTLSHDDDSKKLDECYDPAFVLPVLSSLLAPGAAVSCFKIFRTGLLSIPIMALASYCPKMRAAGYHVLHRFYQQLETETKHKNDKLLLSDFIETLRRSLRSAAASKDHDFNDLNNPRLPTIAAAYLARSLLVITAPFDPLYKPLNNFLIAKEEIDFTVVPDFLNLFHDIDLETTDRRLWVLNLMKEGVKTYGDVNVIFKTMSLKMILDLYSSVLADRKTKSAILSLISSLVAIPRAADILIEAYSLISWLSSVIFSFKSDEKTLVAIAIEIIFNMYTSLRINTLMKNLNPSVKNGEFPYDHEDFKINRDYEIQIVYLLCDLIPHLSELNLEDILRFVRVLANVSKKNLTLFSRQNLTRLAHVAWGILGPNYANDDAKIVYDLIVGGLDNVCREMLMDYNLYSVQFSGDESDDKCLVLKSLWNVVKFYLR